MTRDFTDRKRAEEAVMLQLSSALLANMDVRKLLGAISASITRSDSARRATLGLYDPATGTLIVQFLAPDESELHRRGECACRWKAHRPARRFARGSR